MHNPYDEIEYPDFAHAQTHPTRLATIATLYGLRTAHVTDCRVLELGCGAGGNLIPLAYELPTSTFVGVDLAAQPIAKGQALIHDLELANITLLQNDVMEMDPEFGQFDYIIAHGLYSWVPAAVQDKILSICQMNLAPHGVAYVSYNTYPGSHLRDMLRDMLLYHVQGVNGPRERLDRAQGLLEVLAEEQAQSAGNKVLQQELAELRQHRAGSLYHDELAPNNTALYFHEFVTHAAEHKLQYLGEADFHAMSSEFYRPPETNVVLAQLAGTDPIAKEQYLDFLKCRKFRQTLLCHEAVPIERTIKQECMAEFYISAQLRPQSTKPDLSSAKVETFRSQSGATIQLNHPLVKAALVILQELSPQVAQFSQLLAAARDRSVSAKGGAGHDAVDDGHALGNFLFTLYAANLAELRLDRPRFVVQASARPQASALARIQAQEGEVVTNLLHANVLIENMAGKHLLLLLDGTRSHQTLLRDMAQYTRAISMRDLETNLAGLGRQALLIA